MPFINLFLGWFSAGGVIANFFVSIAKKFSIKAMILPIQYYIVYALFLFKISFLVLLIQTILSLYNSFNHLLQYFNNIQTDTLIEIPLKVLYSMGLIPAFLDAFSVFSVSFTAVLIMFISKYVIESFRLLSDELFKIGVLLQG